MTDIAGMAAIQELSRQLKSDQQQLLVKDREIAELQLQLKSMGENFSARMTALERQQTAPARQTVSLAR